MAFTIPDKGEGEDNRQSILFEEHLNILMLALRGSDFVLPPTAQSCLVSAQVTPDMTVAVAKGSCVTGNAITVVAAGNVTVTTADATHPRIDIVYADTSGRAIRAGTAAAAPKPPALAPGECALAMIWVPAGATSITAARIVDLRVVRDQGVQILKKTTSAVTFSNTNAIQTYFSITLPNGFFTTSRVVRIRCGGTMTINSGTPTVTLTITGGGTTMFADTSGAFTADADLKPWALDLTFVAQNNSDQAMNGVAMLPLVGAMTNPTNGSGDAWSTAQCANPINGSSAVNADAGNYVINVQFTMSVANAANSITMEYATAVME